MSLGTIIYTWFKGNLIGSDEYGNKYYINCKKDNLKTTKRWVIFKDEKEASKVPSHWHAWLHRTVDEPPVNYLKKYSWQKNHLENQTGTENAYFPDAHPLNNSKKNNDIKNTEYESWKPK